MNDEQPNDEVVVAPPIPVQPLEYAVPMAKPEKPTHPVVGILGLLLYGILFLLFGYYEVVLGYLFLSHPQWYRQIGWLPVAAVTLFTGFTGWRAFAALYGTIRTLRKRRSNHGI